MPRKSVLAKQVEHEEGKETYIYIYMKNTCLVHIRVARALYKDESLRRASFEGGLHVLKLKTYLNM